MLSFLWHRNVSLAAIMISALLVPLFTTACETTRPAKESASESPFHVTRQSFAKAFAQIKQGMPADQAQSLLGKPDDIRTQSDPGGISFTGTREIWGYGTDHHLGFATLGTITIDESNHVQYFSGTQGADDLVAQLGEPELRRLMRLLAQTGGTTLSGRRFNPRYTIAAVNALQPLGKQTGVSVLKEYLRVSFQAKWDEDEGLILVMRALFEVPPAAPAVGRAQPSSSERDPFIVVHPGYFRPPMLGAADWEPKDPAKFPRFPLVIVDDIPLLPIGGYTLAGHPESATRHLDYLEREAQWRREPLKPSNDPLGAYTKLVALLQPDEQNDPRLSSMIAGQLLRLIETVYREPPKNNDDEYVPPAQVMASFADAVQKVRPMNIRWNSQSNCYVRSDGSSLPIPIAPLYRRTIFEPHFSDSAYTLKIIVERRNSKRVQVTTELDDFTGTPPAFRLRVIRQDPPETILVDDSSKASGSISTIAGKESSTSTSYSAPLPAGERIRVEVSEANHHFVSPPVEP